MGYFFESVRGDRKFDFNHPMMEIMVHAMESTGVELMEKRRRLWHEGDPDAKPVPIVARLAECFVTNDGWLVKQAECREIGSRLVSFKDRHYTAFSSSVLRSVVEAMGGDATPRRVHISEDELDVVAEFAAFCSQCAKLGGFWVW